MIELVKVHNYRRFLDFSFVPHTGMNIVVGDNEAGKSTLLEAIILAVSGRINGRWAQEDLNPHWFNSSIVDSFFDAIEAGGKPALPTAHIEVYFSKDAENLQTLRGINNTESRDCPGLSITAKPDPEYITEMSEYLGQPNLPRILPTDLYTIEWQDFALMPRSRQPRDIGYAMIDARTGSSSAGIDYKMKQLVRDFVSPGESAQIALEHRRSKAAISSGILHQVNKRISGDRSSFGVGLQMDQSAATNWDAAVTAQISDVPFSFLGSGRQVRTKMALAMSRDAERKRFVMIEEPENHLSHTSLMELIGQIEDLAVERQVFITTHSSYVLNRLGFDSLHLMHEGHTVPFSSSVISEDTVSYFQKQSGYDTLRLVLSKKAVIVEGPSDEMIFNLAYKSVYSSSPGADGIDVIAMGTRGKRALELATALGRKLAVLRDNDGKAPWHWKGDATDYLQKDVREMFIGEPALGRTLEPQFVSCNEDSVLREIFGLDIGGDVEGHMLAHKTEAAWKLLNSTRELSFPPYMLEAVKFIHDC